LNGRYLDIDFLAARRRRKWPGVLSLGVALALTAHLVYRHEELTIAAQHLDAARQALGQPPVGKVAARPDEKAARAAIERLNVPWAELIQTIEAASAEDIALLQLDPDPDQRTLRLTAEARNRGAMFNYLRSLDESQGLTNVRLTTHQIGLDDPQRPIRFSAQASFPAGR
jgi:Tfp pilus assembly protein PilN